MSASNCPAGPLTQYFTATEFLGAINDLQLRRGLVTATRHLICPFLNDTLFTKGLLDIRSLQDLPIHTIFNRRDRNNIPYLLSDLAGDLRRGSVSRLTIDARTEEAIKALAENLNDLPLTPPPVLIEDASAQHYLVLEGNKRFCALALGAPRARQRAFEALVGCSSLTWSAILAQFGMTSAA